MMFSESDGPERSVQDFHRLTHNQFKKIYFKRDPRDPVRIQTIHYYLNIFSGIPEARHSNFNYEEPQPDWVELTPQVEQSLSRYRSLSANLFH
jgi:hypothetical protein